MYNAVGRSLVTLGTIPTLTILSVIPVVVSNQAPMVLSIGSLIPLI